MLPSSSGIALNFCWGNLRANPGDASGVSFSTRAGSSRMPLMPDEGASPAAREAPSWARDRPGRGEQYRSRGTHQTTWELLFLLLRMRRVQDDCLSRLVIRGHNLSRSGKARGARLDWRNHEVGLEGQGETGRLGADSRPSDH